LRPFRAKDVDRLAFLGESLVAPPEVWVCDAQGRAPVRCTNTNALALAKVRMSAPQSMWFKGPDSVAVHAWLHPPVDRHEGQRVPLVLLVHGGPQGSWDDRFSFRWNPQVYAGAGYAVLTPDPRGSSGYGQAFTDGVNGDWAGKPYDDLMVAVDQAVAQTPWIDGSRMAAAGASYGGYMVNWIAGHTDRFRCLVSHAGLFDLESFWGSTEEQWFPEWEFGGPPWEKPAAYAQWSPSATVQNWKTPMLVTLGGRDYRVPDAQGFAMFTALQRRGIPSEMIYFPSENHWILKPQTSILWHDAVLGWLGRWLGPQPAGGAR
jgi:dipeptidyl aminopeptidase/acylaminoacyl peptidase